VTDQNPYQPVPVNIPDGHPALDTSGFTDLRALAEAGLSATQGMANVRGTMDALPSSADLAAAMQTLAAAGISVDHLTTPDGIRAALSPGSYSGPELPPGVAELLNGPSANQPPRRGLRPVGHTCHRCGQAATHQWPRRATDQEAEDWHAAREQWIRQHNDGRPEAEYVSDRSDTVTVAVHGCDDHKLTPEIPVDNPEAAQIALDAGAARRALVHDADCGGHGACGCGGGDDRAA